MDERAQSSRYGSESRSEGLDAGTAGSRNGLTPSAATCVLALLFTMTSCGRPKSPWARKMTQADRVAWMVACSGAPAESLLPNNAGADDALIDYDFKGDRKPDLDLLACNLSWNRAKRRLWRLSVYLADSRVNVAAQAGGSARIQSDRVEPYLSLVLNEVPADLRPAIRDFANRDSGVVGVTIGPFYVDGGYGPPPGYWHLDVREK